MTVEALAKELSLTQLAGNGGNGAEVTGCYLGDLLSWVIGRAAEGDAWITVMGNANAVAVAVLAGISCVILCENAPLDEDARTRAEENGIPVFVTEEKAFGLAVKIAGFPGIQAVR